LLRQQREQQQEKQNKRQLLRSNNHIDNIHRRLTVTLNRLSIRVIELKECNPMPKDYSNCKSGVGEFTIKLTSDENKLTVSKLYSDQMKQVMYRGALQTQIDKINPNSGLSAFPNVQSAKRPNTKEHTTRILLMTFIVVVMIFIPIIVILHCKRLQMQNDVFDPNMNIAPGESNYFDREQRGFAGAVADNNAGRNKNNYKDEPDKNNYKDEPEVASESFKDEDGSNEDDHALYRDNLRKLVRKHFPDRVDEMMAEYSGREEDLVRILKEKGKR